MNIKRKNFTRQERRLINLDYKKYLYDKYKPTFSSASLSFGFGGKEYQLDALIAEFHRIEQEKIYLDYYVTALFILLLCLGNCGVVALDAYLKSIG
jgi:hypothetical protein